MANLRMYCLHGFLGRPSDWTEFEGAWRANGASVSVRAPNLFEDAALGMEDTLKAWADRFCDQVASESREPSFLVGYSLGGRLALHALKKAPELWRGAILISTNPGLAQAEERALRRATDGRWAAHFLEDPWDEVVSRWNRQAVFQGRPSPFHREEREFSRFKLASALWAWSLGAQVLDWRAPKQIPMLWMAGADDDRFTRLAHDGSRLTDSHVSVLPDAAHRVPWENREAFRQTVQDFLNESLFKRGTI